MADKVAGENTDTKKSVDSSASTLERPFTEEEWKLIHGALAESMPKLASFLGEVPYLHVLLTMAWVAAGIIIQKKELTDDFFRALGHFGDSQAATLARLAESNGAIVKESIYRDKPIILIPSLPKEVDGNSSKLVN